MTDTETPSPEPRVQVRKLEWTSWGTSTGGLIYYQIEQGRMAHYGKWKLRISGVGLDGVYDTQDAAKEGAQAHYEARIRSALVTNP